MSSYERMAIPIFGSLFRWDTLRIGDSTTWDSRLGCLKADRMPALQKLGVISPSFLKITVGLSSRLDTYQGQLDLWGFF
jgi:hypothetical protein